MDVFFFNVRVLLPVAMGVFFYLLEQKSDKIDSLGWLPLTSLIVFIAFFSIGYGPIPWLMMGQHTPLVQSLLLIDRRALP